MKERKRRGGIRPLRTNPTALKKEQQDVFIKEYQVHGIVGPAANKAGVHRCTITKWREEDPEFNDRCLHAYKASTDNLIAMAFQRAANGSDNLLMFTIKQRDPSFRDRFDIQHSGANGRPLFPMPSTEGIDLSQATDEELTQIQTTIQAIRTRNKLALQNGHTEIENKPTNGNGNGTHTAN